VVDTFTRLLVVPQHAFTVTSIARRVLDAELEAVLLSKAAQLGLPAEWVSLLDDLDPERRQVLRVRSTTAESDAARVLSSGDMILAVNGQPVTSFTDVESIMAALGLSSDGWQQQATTTTTKAAAAAAEGSEAERPAKRQRSSSEQQQQQEGDASTSKEPCVHLTVFRAGRVLDVDVGLGQEDSLGTDRWVLSAFAGYMNAHPKSSRPLCLMHMLCCVQACQSVLSMLTS
jgi:hypothetical protein